MIKKRINIGYPKPARDLDQKIDKMVFTLLCHRTFLQNVEWYMDQTDPIEFDGEKMLVQMSHHKKNHAEMNDKEMYEWWHDFCQIDKKIERDERMYKDAGIEREMQHRARIFEVNRIHTQLLDWGIPFEKILNLSWDDCPEEYTKFQKLIDDYSLVLHNGIEYEFKGSNQQLIVKYLHEQTQSNATTKAGVLTNLVKSTCLKLRDLFDNGKHPAFNTMIIQEPEGSGNWKLNI